jgi:hypothetical protein
MIFHIWFVYPPATPVDVMVIPKTSEKNNNAELSSLRSQLEYRIARFPLFIPNIPTFHYSIPPKADLRHSIRLIKQMAEKIL